MTKKDYIAIAQAIVDSYIPEPHRSELIDQLCAVFKRDNPGFDKVKFARAVYEGGV